MNIPFPTTPIVQRNQNQSAVGGKDLIGTFGLAIEVKRQEALSINTWWNQCVASAKALDEIPVLLFRQNKGKWRCILETQVKLASDTSVVLRSEISYDDFKSLFRILARRNAPKAIEPKDVGLFG